jgi:hypothetical protein
MTVRWSQHSSNKEWYWMYCYNYQLIVLVNVIQTALHSMYSAYLSLTKNHKVTGVECWDDKSMTKSNYVSIEVEEASLSKNQVFFVATLVSSSPAHTHTTTLTQTNVHRGRTRLTAYQYDKIIKTA